VRPTQNVCQLWRWKGQWQPEVLSDPIGGTGAVPSSWRSRSAGLRAAPAAAADLGTGTTANRAVRLLSTISQPPGKRPAILFIELLVGAMRVYSIPCFACYSSCNADQDKPKRTSAHPSLCSLCRSRVHFNLLVTSLSVAANSPVCIGIECVSRPEARLQTAAPRHAGAFHPFTSVS
jgi:hypothetical protein